MVRNSTCLLFFRYDIAPVYHKSVAGGHPRESLEATFDIIQDETNITSGQLLEAEALLVLCQVLTAFPQPEGKFFALRIASPPIQFQLISPGLLWE